MVSPFSPRALPCSSSHWSYRSTSTEASLTVPEHWGEVGLHGVPLTGRCTWTMKQESSTRKGRPWGFPNFRQRSGKSLKEERRLSMAEIWWTTSCWICRTLVSLWDNTIQYNTTLLSLCWEICFLARHLHKKTFNTINNKTSTTQWNTELKTAQLRGKYLTITMYTCTHACTHARTHTPTHPRTLFFWLTNNLKHSINYNKTSSLNNKTLKSKHSINHNIQIIGSIYEVTY